ncbi:MAG: sulfotransferase [Ilumatobacter sp.]
MGRSGTTVLERSLGTDERVVSLGEVTHLWERSLQLDELCGCGEPFSVCPFWIDVGERAFGGWNTIDPDRVLALKRRVDRTLRTPQLAFRLGRRSWRREVDEYVDLYAKLYQAASEVADADVVIDSSKNASLPWVLRLDDRIDLRVLHCVRDSRAVAYAWTKKVVRPEARDAGGELMHQYSPSTLALKWMQHNLVVEALRLRRTKSERLRYEDWANDPVDGVRRVRELAGLDGPPPASKVAHDWVQLDKAHTCSGNPMRFEVGRVDIRRDETWKSSFPARSRRLVTLLTAPFLIAYRYPA